MRKLRGILIADPAIVLATIIFGSISLIVSFFDRTGSMQAAVARAWARVLLGVSAVRVHVEGLEHIDRAGSYVFIANHLSYMDTPVALANIPVQFRFLAKRGLFKIPFLGNHLSRAGHVPVPRMDPRAAVKTMSLAAEIIQQKKISLLIFPEGGRSRDGSLGPFREGGVYIALKAGVPIVPLAIIGTRDVLPFGASIVMPGNVTLRILPPIHTTGRSLREREALTREVRERIARELPVEPPAELSMAARSG
jgi:1-acyl-sn-glycerol-3-phosphate acyltransferase